MNKLLGLCYAGLVASASAIVVDDYQVAEIAPSNSVPAGAVPATDLNWDYVYNYNGASAVAVNDHWILTAGHVGSAASFYVDDVPYASLERTNHPTADISLIRVDKKLPGYYDLYTGALPLTFEQTPLPVLMVGYGNTGDVYDDYWTRDGSGGGTKRWGSQQIDITFDDDFWMYFDKGRTDWEAGGNTGDSGGGVFYKEGDTWKLAGLNVEIKAKAGTSGLGFDRTVAVSMPYAASWIAAATIPEPAAMGLMGFGTIGLFLARAKRRRKLLGRSVFPIRGDEPLCDRFAAVEGSEDVQKREYDYLAGMLEMIRTSPLAVWMNTLHTRNNALNKAIWRFITAVVEQSSVRKEAAEERVNKVAVKSLDVFLDKISWDRIVTSLKSGSAKATRAMRMGALKSLDVFLAKISWDQLTAAYMRCKKAIRFSSRR